MPTHAAPSTRRAFLGTALAAGASLAATRPPLSTAATPAAPVRFSFVLLGDLHFDALAHHDMAWVEREKPNDVAQIKNYSRITAETTPALLATVRAVIADLDRDPATRVAFLLQAGDLVEGLCGSEELAVRQNREALAALAAAGLRVPVLFTKGNHDITGPGAATAFATVFHPFLGAQTRALDPAAPPVDSARFTTAIGPASARGRAEFAFFDAYDAARSLEWLEAVAARRTADYFFVAVHPPVVPYGARATWHLFASERDRARREKLLALLGDQQAIVLGGHIHRFNFLERRAGRGRFRQFALSSVLSTAAPAPKEVLAGSAAYTPDQVDVEPRFSPTNLAERRAVYAAERTFVDAFDYADLPGYAVIVVDGPGVRADLYRGATRERWKSVVLA
jgi:hypothetical protein